MAGPTRLTEATMFKRHSCSLGGSMFSRSHAGRLLGHNVLKCREQEVLPSWFVVASQCASVYDSTFPF